MGNALITRRGGGGADINGIVYKYKAKTDEGTLMNASEFVDYETIIDLLYSGSSFPALNSGAASYGERFVFQLNDSTFIWGNTGGGYYKPCMRVMTVNESGSVTFGTNTTLSPADSSSSNGGMSNIAKIDDSTFAFVHTGTSDYPKLYVVSVSGTTLTILHYYTVSSNMSYSSNKMALKYFGDGILLVTGADKNSPNTTLDFWFSFNGSKLTLLSPSSGVSCNISSFNLQYDIDNTHVLRANTSGEVQLVSFVPSSQLKTEGTVIKVTPKGYIGFGSIQLKAYANVLKNFNEDTGEMVLVVISRSYADGYPTQAILSVNLDTYNITLIDKGKDSTNFIGYGVKFSEEDFMNLSTGYSNPILSIYRYVPTKMVYRIKNVTTGINLSSFVSSGRFSDGRAWLAWSGVLAGASSSTYNLAIVSMGAKKPESGAFGVTKTSAYNGEDIEVYQPNI